MALQHLRCLAVPAEELHFTRAAERLHIELPPLSRTIMTSADEVPPLWRVHVAVNDAGGTASECGK